MCGCGCLCESSRLWGSGSGSGSGRLLPYHQSPRRESAVQHLLQESEFRFTSSSESPTTSQAHEQKTGSGRPMAPWHDEKATGIHGLPLMRRRGKISHIRTLDHKTNARHKETRVGACPSAPRPAVLGPSQRQPKPSQSRPKQARASHRKRQTAKQAMLKQVVLRAAVPAQRQTRPWRAGLYLHR